MNLVARVVSIAVCATLSIFLNLVTTNDTAQAATPKCDRVRNKYLSGTQLYQKLPATATTFSCYMNYGTTGTRVKALQRALRYCNDHTNRGGFIGSVPPLYVDGDYGSVTTGYVINQQVRIWPQNSSEWDGVYGPDTGANIRWPVYGPGEDGSSCNQRFF